MASSDEKLTVTFSARLWAPIDATMDNSVSMAHEDGDADIYVPGHRVREAGWAAMRAAPETNDIGWPPKDYPMPITATRGDWVFVLDQLDRWEPYGDETDSWFYNSARQTIETAIQGWLVYTRAWPSSSFSFDHERLGAVYQGSDMPNIALRRSVHYAAGRASVVALICRRQCSVCR
jgi:hypothetical protein